MWATKSRLNAECPFGRSRDNAKTAKTQLSKKALKGKGKVAFGLRLQSGLDGGSGKGLILIPTLPLACSEQSSMTLALRRRVTFPVNVVVTITRTVTMTVTVTEIANLQVIVTECNQIYIRTL